MFGMMFFFFLSVNVSTGESLPDVPHYKFYVPTPAKTYEGEILDFYSLKDAYGEFSNFALFPIWVDELMWPSSEHYYQAHKYTDPQLIEQIRNAASPMDAARMGRDPNIPKRSDWESYKDVAMEIAVRAKFSQYPILMTLLKSTNSSVLYEHTKNDCYWGDCGDRTGKNKLGLLLMKLRAESYYFAQYP